ncbi:MAG: DNA polymerase III subunit alpha [Desulfarculaceae bacterium]|nr:DNA polymerase III subunit alpha [Desulfarculaceae bacterium]
MSDLSSTFYHLHVHTEYSLLDGAIRFKDLFPRCREFGMDSVAITDHGTMFGVAQFNETAVRNNIKPVIGCEVYVAPRTIDKKTSYDHKELSHLVLLAKNRQGYANLCNLVSIAQLRGFYYKPRVDHELLKTYSEGLIALSACLKGEIPKLIMQNRPEEADRKVETYLSTFGEDNFYLEIQQNGMEIQHKVNQGLYDMSGRLSVPMVATNDCHYLSREDKRAHEVLLCVQTGDTLADSNRFKFDSDELFFKSPELMIESFADYPGAVENTGEIVSRCNVEFDDKVYHFPRFDCRADKSEDEIFREKVEKGFEEKLQLTRARNPNLDEQVYRDRIAYEIGVILDMGFPGYFLIVADFIEHARKIGVPVGPGRGSAAGSMVAYSLDITAIDPIEHGLIFERFLNPSRISMPDIDVDFCIEGREAVYNYVVQRYGGGENVCQIITFGKLKAKAVIRDVGRALGVPLPEVDEIAKMIPDNTKNLKSAIEDVPRIREKASENETKHEMLEISQLLEGLPRHASTHAAGVVIGDKPLVNYLPLYKGKEGETLTQFDMNYVEKIGLVKFDFLGLRNLTVIKNTLEVLRQSGKTVPDIDNLDLNDEKTFELLRAADTTGVFQLESSGMKDLIRRLKPEYFTDIVALVALYRPGPLESGMADSYVERKHGRQKVEYLFPQLEQVLKETYGVILYQEQVMKIAGLLANYSMADADGLRKAMGKKKLDMMEEHRKLFMKGAEENGLDLTNAAKLFDLMEKFGGYGFNKSHSAAYALISYQTAYLKAHFPVEFIAALMTSEMNNTDNILKYLDECKTHDIEILPPDINESAANFSVDNNRIRYGLAAVKNVGEAAIEEIIKARNEQGRFESIFDFCEKVGPGKANKKVLESLIKCGAFDSTGDKRSRMAACLEEAIDHGARIHKEKADCQLDLFSDTDIGVNLPAPVSRMPAIEEWEEPELLLYEKESLGFYLTGHPLEKYEALIQKYCNAASDTLEECTDSRSVRMGGIIRPVKELKTKKGDMMAFAMIEDTRGGTEVVVFPDTYVDAHNLIKEEAAVLVEGSVQKRESSTNLIAEKIIPIEQAEQEWTASMVIQLDASSCDKETVARLKRIADRYPGECSAYIAVAVPDKPRVIVQLPEDCSVACDPDFLKEVEELLGSGAVTTKCAPVKQKNKNKKWQKRRKTG